MATYAVGDIQGCFKTFCKLLDAINFDDKKDTLFLLGDVINRGPDSLNVLRFIKDNASSIKMVLGNHDIFALVRYYCSLLPNKKHSLDELFSAEDAPMLMSFLRKQPLIIHDQKNIFVHAGILPNIEVLQALAIAKEIESIIASETFCSFFNNFFEHPVIDDHDNNTHEQKLKVCLFSFIYMRMCLTQKKMETDYTGSLKNAPSNLIPWFKLRNDNGYKIFFGHWAAIGVHIHHDTYFGLDSGCVWGNSLSAYSLTEKKLFQIKNCE